MPDDADKELINRILGGGVDSKVAFKELYDRYQNQVFNICYRLTGEYHRAADATQESFLAALRGLRSFHYQSSFKTWLAQVTKNAALQQLRKSSSRSFSSLEGEEETGGGGPKGSHRGRHRGSHRGSHSLDKSPRTADPEEPDQLEAAIENEFERDLQKVINRLKRQHAEVLVLRYFGNSSYEELAEILGCSIGTIKSRLNRAHRALKPYLNEVLKKHGRPEQDHGSIH